MTRYDNPIHAAEREESRAAQYAMTELERAHLTCGSGGMRMDERGDLSVEDL